jgi:hypothetical protein
MVGVVDRIRLRIVTSGLKGALVNTATRAGGSLNIVPGEE